MVTVKHSHLLHPSLDLSILVDPATVNTKYDPTQEAVLSHTMHACEQPNHCVCGGKHSRSCLVPTEVANVKTRHHT